MAIRRNTVLLSIIAGGIGAVGLYLGSPGSVSIGPSASLGAVFFDYNPYAVAPMLPTCTVANSCTLQCKASTSGNVWQCTKGDGTAVTVTQGTGSVAELGPQGIAHQFVDDTTAPTITSANLGTILQDYFTSDHTVIATGGAIAAAPGAINYLFRLADAGVQSFDLRHESGTKCIWTDTTKTPTNATVTYSSSEGVLTGLSFLACRKSGTSYTAWQNTNSTSTTWAQSVGTISGTTAYFGRHSSTTLYLNGWLQSITFYAAAKTDAELALIEDQWMGTAPSTSQSGLGLATFHSGKTFAPRASDGKQYAFSNAVPRVVTGSSAGLLIDEGVGTNASWAADPTNASTWTAVGTPTTTANQDSGPFSKYRNGAEADLIVDDDAGAFEGYTSVRSAGTAAGKYTAWCWVRSGTSGVTTNKVRMSVVATGGTSAGSADCDFSDLTSTFTQKKCVATITGTATTIQGRVTVGNATTDTGSVIVSFCQIDDDPFINDPHFGDTAIGVDNVFASNTEVDAWNTAGGDYVSIFTPNFSRVDLTPSPDTDDSYEIFDLYNDAKSDHRVLAWHYNYANPAIATRGSGQPTTSTDTYATSDYNEVAGTKYALRVKWKKCADPTFSKHWVYLDTCSDPNTCLPTTAIGSDETCTKYSPTTTDWGGLQIGCRYSVTVCMLGTIHRITARTAP
jgi:hypothetical protein